MLIVEDDATFARILLGLARDRGFRGLMARTGADGIALARQFVPDAITLDIGLPDVDGWALLDQLKRDPPPRASPCTSSRARSSGRRPSTRAPSRTSRSRPARTR